MEGKYQRNEPQIGSPTKPLTQHRFFPNATDILTPYNSTWSPSLPLKTYMYHFYTHIISLFPYSSGSKGTAAKIKLASDPFLVSFFSHVPSGSSGFFAYFFMPSQTLCAFLQVCALFFLAIKFNLL